VFVTLISIYRQKKNNLDFIASDVVQDQVTDVHMVQCISFILMLFLGFFGLKCTLLYFWPMKLETKIGSHFEVNDNPTWIKKKDHLY
jgi:hypothetical protein